MQCLRDGDEIARMFSQPASFCFNDAIFNIRPRLGRVNLFRARIRSDHFAKVRREIHRRLAIAASTVPREYLRRNKAREISEEFIGITRTNIAAYRAASCEK